MISVTNGVKGSFNLATRTGNDEVWGSEKSVKSTAPDISTGNTVGNDISMESPKGLNQKPTNGASESLGLNVDITT